MTPKIVSTACHTSFGLLFGLLAGLTAVSSTQAQTNAGSSPVVSIPLWSTPSIATYDASRRFLARVTDANGAPLANRLVEFAVGLCTQDGCSSDPASLGHFRHAAQRATAMTNTQGIAYSPPFIGGPISTLHRLQITLPIPQSEYNAPNVVRHENIIGTAASSFTLARVVAKSPEALLVTPGQVIDAAFRVQVLDANGIPMAGQRIRFTSWPEICSLNCQPGGNPFGKFEGGLEHSDTVTDANGYATSTHFHADADDEGWQQVSVSLRDLDGGNGAYYFDVETSASATAGLAINQGVGGSWFNPATPGQGLIIDLLPDTGFMFLGWFTYMPKIYGIDEDRLWLTASGLYRAGESKAELTVYASSYGRFNEAAPVITGPVGVMTLHFEDCSKGSVRYTLYHKNLQGEFPIARQTTGMAELCRSLAAATAGNAP